TLFRSKEVDEARAELDGLEVGGRNLIIQSNNFDDYVSGKARRKNEYEGAKAEYELLRDGYTRITTTGGSSALKLVIRYFELREFMNEDLGLSYDLKNNSEKNVLISHNALSDKGYITYPAKYEGRVVEKIKPIGNYTQLNLRAETSSDDLDISIRNLKVER